MDRVITRTEVEAARKRIRGRVRTTPVIDVEERVFGVPVTLKLELLQHAGSFKPRGVFNRVLGARVPRTGLIAASGGNAGLAVAHVARELWHPAEIFVPESAPAAKVDKLRTLGATVTVTGAHYAEALHASAVRAAETDALVVHAYDHDAMIAGNGTLALELEEQLDGVDTVLVAVGGGGLVAGIAAALAGRARVVAVEPERCPTMRAALSAGHPVDVRVGGIAADSLGATRVGDACFEVVSRTGIASVLVSDEAVERARRRLWDTVRVAAEPGGAAALAAILSGAYRPEPDERIVAVVCGGNADPATLS